MQEKLGVADFSQTYAHNEQTIRVLFYRTQRKHKDGLTTKDECSILIFVDGELKHVKQYENEEDMKGLVKSFH
jgi:hypothetical protein